MEEECRTKERMQSELARVIESKKALELQWNEERIKFEEEKKEVLDQIRVSFQDILDFCKNRFIADKAKQSRRRHSLLRPSRTAESSFYHSSDMYTIVPGTPGKSFSHFYVKHCNKILLI